MFAAGASHLRVREGHQHRPSRLSSNCFFDLVFVFAITQLSHHLLAHLTPLGFLQTALLMIAVWWIWIDTAWITNCSISRRPYGNALRPDALRIWRRPLVARRSYRCASRPR